MEEEFVAEEQEGIPEIPLIISLSCILLMELLIIGILYVWMTFDALGHQPTIVRRFVSVAMVTLMAAFLVFSSEKNPKLQGSRLEGLWQALPLPYCLTTLVFLAPILVNLLNILHL